MKAFWICIMETMETKSLKRSEHTDDDSSCLNYPRLVHRKVKHALRQQVKRRRKNTTIASGNSRSLPRIVHTLPSISTDLNLSGISQHNHIVIEETAATMKEVLASLPGFSIKSNRRRSTKKLSIAAQLEAGLVDLQSPASILTNTSLRALLNRHTFQGLPPLYQRKLAQLLPSVDRQDAAISGLNNEFFARACQEWRKRLADGEFTSENQQRLKMEIEKDKLKLDPWKLKHFEPIWGEKKEIYKLKSRLQYISKEQKLSKTVTRSIFRSQSNNNLNPIISTHQYLDVPLKGKEVHSLTSHTCNTSVEGDLPEFNVTVRILEDDDDDENEEDEDDDDDDDDIDDDDLDEDEDENEDEEEEDDEEDEDEEEDDVETQVSLTYLNQESQHCRIIVASTDDDEFDDEKLSNEIPVSEKSKYPKGMIFDFINNRKFVNIDKINEIKCDLNSHSIGRFRNTSIKEFKISAESSTDTQLQKLPECSFTDKEDDFISISENNLSKRINLQKDTLPNLKFSLKSESLNEDAVKSKLTSKQKSFEASTVYSSDEQKITCDSINNENSVISEVIDIDNETLQRIHELEVQGEMQEAYEEISGCPEDMMYPILEDIQINSSSSKSPEVQITENLENRDINDSISSGAQEEAFQEANNYVCSAMMDCTWATATADNNFSDNKECIQDTWPVVVSTVDSTVSTNITITSDNCTESQSLTEQKISRRQNEIFNSNKEDSDFINFVQVPSSSINSESSRISTPVSSCLMKNVHSAQNSSIISLPHLQSIRVFQRNFQTSIEHSSSETIFSNPPICTQIKNPNSSSQQLQTNLNNFAQSTILCKSQKDLIELNIENEFSNQTHSAISETSLQEQNIQTCGAVVLQKQTLLPLDITSHRQIITTLQPQQPSHYSMIMSIPSKSNRNSGILAHRSSKNGTREQFSNRSRNITKEPPGAVNLERSYQICQAVIASSPNRDQLKAQLKPPPSLLTKGEKNLNSNKFSTRIASSSRSQKNALNNQGGTFNQNKYQGVMLKHVFSSRQHFSEEISENSTNQTNCHNAGFILVKKSGVPDSTPRASSAPPIPPQMTGISVGLQLLRGRPASAGEASLQSFSFKHKRAEYAASDDTEFNNASIILGNNNLPQCECSMQGAMIICRQCGAYCHDDCISPQYICALCLVR